MKATTYFHTLRHLKPVQVYARVRRYVYRPQADLSPAPPVRRPSGAWSPSPGHEPQLLGPRTFRFLNETRELTSAGDWNSRASKLWLYNLHYFGDLIAEGFSDRLAWHRQLLERWTAENLPGAGNGWESYPLSQRIVNWIKWTLAGAELSPALLHSLAVQARYLSRQLEYHLLGNHLFANAKALVFAGAFFSGPEADRLLDAGLELLASELREQFLADGGHFERSPMYHSMLTEDLIDLVQLRCLYPALMEHRRGRVFRIIDPRPMLRWLQVMTHPDGGIAFFNDAAFGSTPSCATLFSYARALGLAVPQRSMTTIEPLPESGYVRLESGSAVLIADVGAIGPDYQPGHAHADTLSFELSLHGRRMLVNGGTSTYDVGEERFRQRGTAAHNTVVVDGQNSSEVWSSFRVARRAKPFDVSWGETGAGVWLRGAHDGYRRLPGRPVHRREWWLTETGLRVIDTVDGSCSSTVARFRLHPTFTLHCDGEARGVIEGAGLRLRWQAEGSSLIRCVQSTWHPAFGISESCWLLELAFVGGPLETQFHWE